MGRFSGAGQAKLVGKGDYLNEGDYRLRIKKCEYVNTQKGPAYVVSFDVISASLIEFVNGKGSAENINVNPSIRPAPELIGKDKTWFQGMGTTPAAQDTAFSALKMFVFAVEGFDPALHSAIELKAKEGTVDQTLEDSVTELQKLAGEYVDVSVRQIKTRDKGNLFSRHTFKCVPDAELAQYVAA